MSKRSSWCEFSTEERKYMKKRDNNMCVICGNRGALEAMHIFVSRAKGGRGIRTNGVMGCCRCHRIMDNPIGTTENNISKKNMEKCQKYLIEKEHIKDIKQLKYDLIYHKQQNVLDLSLIKINEQNSLNNSQDIKETQEYCKNCKFLVKNKIQNSTMPSYYCKYRKINLHKNTKACKKYES